MGMFYTTPPKSKRQKQSKRAIEMAAENQKLFEGLKRGTSKSISNAFPNLKVESNVAPTSNVITGSVFPKRDLLHDHKWKKDSTESKQTIEAINRKASSIAPAYSKGALQLPIESELDPITIAAGRRR